MRVSRFEVPSRMAGVRRPAASRGHPMLQIRRALVAAIAVSFSCSGSEGASPLLVAPVLPDTVVTVPGVPVIPQPGSFDESIAVDARVLHQAMEGFGTAVRLFSDPHVIGRNGGIENGLDISKADEDEILRRLYQQIGLTRIRSALQTPGIEAANDNDNPLITDISRFQFKWVFGDGHIDLLRRVRALGVTTWWLSPGTLEQWMDEGSAAEYVEWTMAVLRHWRDAGAEPPFHSIINEPTHPRANVSGAFIHDVVKLLGPRLKAENFATKLVISDDIHAYHAVASAKPTLEDPETRQYIAALAFHLYDHPVEASGLMKALADQYGLPLWMSEFAVAGDFMEWAVIMHRLISEYNVSAVDYVWGFFGSFDTQQLVRIDYAGSRYLGHVPLMQFYTTGQFSKYVRPGAKRIAATSSAGAVKASAFLRDGRATIVVINERDVAVRARVSLSGISGAGSVTLVRTSSTEQMATIGRVEISGDAFTVELPARSISTLVQ